MATTMAMTMAMTMARSSTPRTSSASRSACVSRSAARSGARSVLVSRVAAMGLLAMLMVLETCNGEQMVATTHPAPAFLPSSPLLGIDAVSLAASAQYYISYGSLDANRAPCPAGTGRSYYTQSCQGSGAVQPYVRSCNQITRCARG